MIFAAICAALSLVVVVMLHARQARIDAIREAFACRQRIPLEKFMALLDDPHVQTGCVERALRKLTLLFGVEPGTLLPDDRFGIELGHEESSAADSSLAAFRFEVAHYIKKYGSDLRQTKIRTVRDFIVLMHRIETSQK